MTSTQTSPLGAALARPLGETIAAAILDHRESRQTAATATRTPAPAPAPTLGADGRQTAAQPPPRPLDVRAARQRLGIVDPPAMPDGALRFVADGEWRWVWVQPGVVDGPSWLGLVARLCAASPWPHLDVRLRPMDDRDGLTSLRTSRDGRSWCTVTLDPRPDPEERRYVLRHELGHVVHAIAAGPGWPALSRHVRYAERVADHLADRYITPDADVAQLLAVARAYRGPAGA